MTTVPPPRRPASHAAAARKSTRHWWRWALLAAIALVVAWAGLLSWDVWQLRTIASDMETSASAASTAVKERDAETLGREVTAVQASAADFAEHTTGPQWTIASWIPWLKDQTVPVQQAGASVQVLADDALKPLSDIDDLTILEVPPIDNGRIDPYVLEPYRETLAQAADALASETAALAGVDTSGSIDMVADQIDSLGSQIAQVGNLVQGAHVAAELMPSMLGAEGERTYVVMVQNNAEPRASGGIPGATIGLSVNDGVLSLTNYVAAADMSDNSTLVAPLTDDETRIFTNRMAWYPQDVNFTPEFPRAAQLMAAFWEREFGVTPDGVLSVDPVALQYMLADMEPTDIGGVTLTGDNLASVMLNQVYFDFDDPGNADAFFALTASTLFGDLLSADNSALASGLEKAAAEDRISLWSANAEEQALLSTTGIDGNFVRRADALGVFLNDGSGSKIGYYIHTEVDVKTAICGAETEQSAPIAGRDVTVTLTHTYDGSVSDLPEYVSGGGVFVPSGNFEGNLMLYSPQGAGVSRLTVNGEPASFLPEMHHDRALSVARVALEPGQSATFTFTLTAPETADADMPIVVTPGPAGGDFVTSALSPSTDC
ncbi:DUF4012 domain-containing protein [Demequina sediminicola]|uniref:DUF4012 domain-containing protein n=1 Tax=Demequina sediminicola TaxID=1095026 RepID=UPI000784DCFA|nr:DUF4012 domain-containing protein [Demequina sediminicola]